MFYIIHTVSQSSQESVISKQGLKSLRETLEANQEILSNVSAIYSKLSSVEDSVSNNKKEIISYLNANHKTNLNKDHDEADVISAIEEIEDQQSIEESIKKLDDITNIFDKARSCTDEMYHIINKIEEITPDQKNKLVKVLDNTLFIDNTLMIMHDKIKKNKGYKKEIMNVLEKFKETKEQLSNYLH